MLDLSGPAQQHEVERLSELWDLLHGAIRNDVPAHHAIRECCSSNQIELFAGVRLDSSPHIVNVCRHDGASLMKGTARPNLRACGT